MTAIRLKIQKLPHCQALPVYATKGSAGLDLTAALDKPLTLSPGERTRIPTGLMVEIPEGFEGQIRARSGLAFKAGLSLTNGIGTIDSDYRGEVMVLIINHGQEAHTFQPGDRIAQLVIMAVPKVSLEVVEEVNKSEERGAGGFGSTGTTLLAANHVQ
jgi:dUTP pyrophosphatase